jgi:hypothetical protein
LCRAAAFKFSTPCSFHFRFGHPRSLMPSSTGPPVTFAASHIRLQQDVEINILHRLFDFIVEGVRAYVRWVSVYGGGLK